MINFLTPLAPYQDVVLLIVRFIAGATMLYYGWGKIKDTKGNARWFSGVGFKPGWLWGALATLNELVGGLLILLGWFVWLPAIGFGVQMIMGAIWKVIKTNKPFTDWSYDLLLLALMLALLAFGPGHLILSW